MINPHEWQGHRCPLCMGAKPRGCVCRQSGLIWVREGVADECAMTAELPAVADGERLNLNPRWALWRIYWAGRSVLSAVRAWWLIRQIKKGA